MLLRGIPEGEEPRALSGTGTGSGHGGQGHGHAHQTCDAFRLLGS